MSALDVLSFFTAFPFGVILALLLYYRLKRAAWKHNKRRGKSGFCPSSAALGVVLLFGHNFIRPSLAHVIEVVQHEEREEDDEGDPEAPEKRLHRQLQKIRRGESVDHLTLRLSPPSYSTIVGK